MFVRDERENGYEIFTPTQLAERWGCAIQTLANLRAQGRGPSYTKPAGKVMYRLVDVIDYEQRCIVFTSEAA